MEQKDYKLEIVKILLFEKEHIREIARKLNTNHMRIVRKLKEMLKENIVDFIQKGRNKYYFIKKTSEGRIFSLMAEQYFLFKTIRKYPYLRDIVEKIQEDKRITLAFLFGSHVKEIAGKDSDIDIFIQTNNLKIKKEYSALDSKLSIKIGRLGKDNLSKEIKKNHAIIKGGEIYYEKIFN